MMKLIYAVFFITISQLPAALAVIEDDAEPELVIHDANLGQIWKLSGKDDNGNDLFGCWFRFVSERGADIDISVEAKGNFARNRGRYLCSINQKRRYEWWGYNKWGKWKKQSVRMYDFARKAPRVEKWFGVSDLSDESDVISAPVSDYDGKTRSFRIINKSKGRLLKLEVFSVDEAGITTDRTGELNDYGDYYACEDGWHMNKVTRVCDKNVCTCSFGTPSDPCYDDGTESCASCDSGYWVDGTSCSKNVCTCVSAQGIGSRWTLLGEPAAWENCPENGMNKCASCKEGLALDDNFHCGDEKTFCYCNNGVSYPAGHDECLPWEPKWSYYSFRESCKSCNFGYYLKRKGEFPSLWTYQEWGCSPNVCSCSHGGDATAADCSVNGGPQCEWCSSGYKLDDENVCVTNVCICENGTPSVGMDCYVEGLKRCGSCNENFEKKYYGFGFKGYLEWGCEPVD